MGELVKERLKEKRAALTKYIAHEFRAAEYGDFSK